MLEQALHKTGQLNGNDRAGKCNLTGKQGGEN